MAKTVASPFGEPHRWLVLILALIGVGLLPKRWEKGVTAAAAVAYFLR